MLHHVSGNCYEYLSINCLATNCLAIKNNAVRGVVLYYFTWKHTTYIIANVTLNVVGDRHTWLRSAESDVHVLMLP